MSSRNPADPWNESGALPERAGEPFRVVGSLNVLVSAEELEAGFAEAPWRQAELFEVKMRSIFE